MKVLIFILILIKFDLLAQAQEFEKFRELDFSKYYGIGDLHLDQVVSSPKTST